MSDQIGAALIGLAGSIAVAIIIVFYGQRLWESQKLNAVRPLTEARIERYTPLWELTDYGSAERPKNLPVEQRRELADRFRGWYYQGGGLLLSEGARRQWTAVVKQLERDDPRPSDVLKSMSCLRTRLKQDIHVHDPDIDDTTCREEEGWRRPPESV